MRAPSGVRRTRSTVAARRSVASLVGTPVLLQVADQRGAEVAVGLLARVDAHVFAEDVQRLLADAQGAPVGDAADRAGTRELGRSPLERGVHLTARDDLVGELL